MEPDPSLSDGVRLKHGMEPSCFLADDKKRIPLIKDGKSLGRPELRSRNGRGRRGSGKPNGILRNSDLANVSNSTALSKSPSKPKAEPSEPLLIEAGFKVVIRRLPPTLPEKVLMGAITPFAPPNSFDWFRFISGKRSDNPSKPRVYSRAYIRFTYQEDADLFIRHFNGHKFVDKRGIQDQSMTGYAFYPKTPKEVRPDPKQGTIEDAPDYVAFIKSLSAEKNEPALLQPSQATITCAPQTTPLIEFLRSQKAEHAESHLSAKSKPPLVLLSRNGKPKPTETTKAHDFEVKVINDDKKLKKPKPPKTVKEEKVPLDPKGENGDPSSGRRPRRRLRKKAGGREEGPTPFTPTQILKPPLKGQDSEWPEPGPNPGSLNGSVVENSFKNLLSHSAKPRAGANPSNSAPVRHVFKLTNGCLIPTTASGDIAETSKATRPRRRRPPPAASKPQTAS